MAKAQVKTVRNDRDVDRFIDSVDNRSRREDCRTVVQLMRTITGEAPRMWGTSIVGFGCQPYRYESGREGEWFLTGVSPRKQSLTLYVMGGFEPHAELLTRLGKHKIGKSCLYINRLSDVDPDVLAELIEQGVALQKEKGPDDHAC